jgi:hypothetical protein
VSGVVRRQGEDGWDFDIADRGARVEIDYAVTVATSDGYVFRIEQPLVLTDADGQEHLLVPEGDPMRLRPALSLARTAVAGARAFDDGRLELDFADGSMIRVPCGEDYEPWEATGPAGLKVVAVPGGELSVWR